MATNQTIATVSGPGIAVEKDPESGASVTIEGRLEVTINTSMPNPNLDYYFYNLEWLYENYGIVDIKGRDWKWNSHNTNEIAISWWLDRDDVLESARMRAAEDYSSVEDVLERWQSLSFAPGVVIDTYDGL